MDSVAHYRRDAFRTVADLERLRTWVDSPAAQGLEHGMALWALGRHGECSSILESELASHPALAVCLSQSYAAAGRFDDAAAVLGSIEEHPDRAGARLAVAEARGDADELQELLEEHRAALTEADEKYYSGRVRELRRDPEAAIALYDEALALDDTHRSALFRLAINVDLRGEDEEARVLYERALMCPPVNTSCVLNLGILYEDIGNYRRAMNCFDLVVQADPENQRARLYRRDAASSLTMYYDEEQDTRASREAKLLRTPIGEFELSVRCASGLARMNVRTIGDLVAKRESELLACHNFGDSSLTEIKEVLRHKGLHLNMSGAGAIAPEIAERSADRDPAEPPDPNSPDARRRPVQELDLSIRSRRVIDAFGLVTIGDLADKTEGELLSCPNFGQTSLNEIKRQLNELGLALRAS